MTNDVRPRNLYKVFVPAALAIGITVGALSWVKSTLAPRPEGGAAVVALGETLPDFKLRTFKDGRAAAQMTATELLAKQKTKVLLVNFWATWCEACVVEMPSLVKLRQKFKDRGFEIAVVSVDQNPEAVVPKALRSFGIDFETFIDPEGELAEVFDVHAIPLTVVMDAKRKILWVENGERDWNSPEIHSKMEQWLSP